MKTKQEIKDKSRFLNRDEILKEIDLDTEVGRKHIKIQERYIKSLKEGQDENNRNNK